MSDDEYAAGDNSAVAGGGERDRRAPRFSWTPAYEATFFRSLCESVQLGLRENHSFKTEAWDRAAAALRDKHNAFPTKSHLVNKSDNARKKFRLWRGLREDPEFLYNPTNRTVTASEDAWKAHITKEPLSRALRGRPFEHEEYMEILYPDVVGSGGAPKRIMKTRRKGPDAIPGNDDGDMPGTAVLDLHVDSTYIPPPPSGAVPSIQPPVLTQPISRVVQGTAVPHPRPTSTAIPPRTAITSSSALTPPEETIHTRKRFMVGGHASGSASGPGDPKSVTTAGSAGAAEKRRRISANTGKAVNGGPLDTPAQSAITVASRQLLEEGLLALADALKSRTSPRWPEQAMDIFYRDFSEEDMDLQLKIAEKVLADENKAMVFCKMPTALRKHWVKRLREMHNRSA